MYTRSPQGLPRFSEYQEELTDIVFGDMILQGKIAKWADNIYIGADTERDFVKNVRGLSQNEKRKSKSISSKDDFGD